MVDCEINTISKKVTFSLKLSFKAINTCLGDIKHFISVKIMFIRNKSGGASNTEHLGGRQFISRPHRQIEEYT